MTATHYNWMTLVEVQKLNESTIFFKNNHGQDEPLLTVTYKRITARGEREFIKPAYVFEQCYRNISAEKADQLLTETITGGYY